MNENYQTKEELSGAGLTTAALAAAGEPVASKNDLDPRETEARPKEVRAGGASTIIGGNGVAAAGAAVALTTDEQAAPLLSPEEAKEFRARWDAIQGGFVDEPRRAVE